MSNKCCPSKTTSKDFQFDPILHPCLLIIFTSLTAYYGLGLDNVYLHDFSHSVTALLGDMWWGVVLGTVFVGLMNKIPRDYFQSMLGCGRSFSGILRAAAAGLIFDLCSHGILMIGAKLYERGASLAQVITFLIASPWNSLSLTLILVALISLKWTLVFIAGSAVIAIVTGVIINWMTLRGWLPENPNAVGNKDPNFKLFSQAKRDLAQVKWSWQLLHEIIFGSAREVQILLRWLLLGIVMAACIRAFVPTENFTEWFGPTLAGLGMTLLATTLIEVCSEGSSPIAAELVNRANAPGNGFAFLMAGAATDYTEIMVLKDTTKSWISALILPIVSVPQILVIGYWLNIYGTESGL